MYKAKILFVSLIAVTGLLQFTFGVAAINYPTLDVVQHSQKSRGMNQLSLLTNLYMTENGVPLAPGKIAISGLFKNNNFQQVGTANYYMLDTTSGVGTLRLVQCKMRLK